MFVLSQSEYEKIAARLPLSICQDFFKPFYEASQLDSYYYQVSNKFWLVYTDTRRKDLLETHAREYAPLVDHFREFAAHITSDNKPFGLHRAKREENFTDKEKILFVRKTPHPKFVMVPIPYFVDESVYLILWHRPQYDPRFLLSLLNSALANWYFSTQKRHGEQLQIDKEEVLSFPIISIDLSSPDQTAKYKLLVNLVDQIVSLKTAIHNTSDFDVDERKQLEKHEKSTRDKIDDLVFSLYHLTQEERAVVKEWAH